MSKGAGKGKASPLQNIGAECKVWVGGLSPDVQWKQLEEHFKAAGKTKWTEVLPKGVACVAFASADDVTTAIAMLNGTELNGQVIQVDNWEEKPKTGGKASGPRAPSGGSKGTGKSWGGSWGVPVWKPQFKNQKGGGSGPWGASGPWGGGWHKGQSGKGKGKGKSDPLKAIEPECKVWVGDLDPSVTWKQLQEHFNQIGKTTWVEVLPKGTACIAYGSAEEASTAIAALNGSKFAGTPVTVDVWTKKERTST